VVNDTGGTPPSRPEGTPPLGRRGLGTNPFLRDDGRQDGPAGLRLFLAFLAAGAAAGLAALLLTAPERLPVLPILVDEHLSRSGVANPVTAVLLNFRSYDTLLEVVVLVVAMVAVWSMDRGNRELAREEGEQLDDPILQALARVVVPLVGVTAVFLTWAGSHRPGGAFQAGALLAGAGVLLAAAGFLHPPTAASRVVRALVALGAYVFIGVGLGVIPWSGHFLAYPETWAYPLILGVEAVLTLSIAVVLVELFVDVPSVPDPDPSLARLDPTGDPLGRLLNVEGDLVEDPDDNSGEGP
jgi:multisubunit Na+/H+ antiporter MnhB subunit